MRGCSDYESSGDIFLLLYSPWWEIITLIKSPCAVIQALWLVVVCFFLDEFRQCLIRIVGQEKPRCYFRHCIMMMTHSLAALHDFLHVNFRFLFEQDLQHAQSYMQEVCEVCGCETMCHANTGNSFMPSLMSSTCLDLIVIIDGSVIDSLFVSPESINIHI